MPYADPQAKKAYDSARYAADPEAAKARSSARRIQKSDDVKLGQRQYRERTRERRAAYARAYYQANRIRIDTMSAAWRAAHPEAHREYVQRSKRLHPQTNRDYKKRRKARLRGAPSVEYFKAVEIYERDAWTCGICRVVIRSGDESIDHIIPVSKGGSHTRANVRAAHYVCNRNRGNRE